MVATSYVRMAVVVMGFAVLGVAGRAEAQAEEKASWPAALIVDNSFLVEEAFNQEEGVVQHVNTLTRSGSSPRDYVYMLTQEWPFQTQRHQLSYSVPMSVMGSTQASGLGDVMFNYRYQVPGLGDRTLIAPRFSVLAASGNADRGLGGGSWGTQVNLPVSLRVTPAIAAHLNAGATFLNGVRGELDNGTTVRRAVNTYTFAGSLIAPVTMPVNAVVEYVVNNVGSIGGNGAIVRETQHLLNPGIRFAVNAGPVQFVPGFSVTMDAARPSGPKSLFMYLSIEHAFKRVAR